MTNQTKKYIAKLTEAEHDLEYVTKIHTAQGKDASESLKDSLATAVSNHAIAKAKLEGYTRGFADANPAKVRPFPN